MERAIRFPLSEKKYKGTLKFLSTFNSFHVSMILSKHVLSIFYFVLYNLTNILEYIQIQSHKSIPIKIGMIIFKTNTYTILLRFQFFK